MTKSFGMRDSAYTVEKPLNIRLKSSINDNISSKSRFSTISPVPPPYIPIGKEPASVTFANELMSRAEISDIKKVPREPIKSL